jgi:hypothetical protein
MPTVVTLQDVLCSTSGCHLYAERGGKCMHCLNVPRVTNLGAATPKNVLVLYYVTGIAIFAGAMVWLVYKLG